MKFFVVDREQLSSNINPIVDSFATRPEAESFITNSEYGAEYAIEEGEKAEDIWTPQEA